MIVNENVDRIISHIRVRLRNLDHNEEALTDEEIVESAVTLLSATTQLALAGRRFVDVLKKLRFDV